jgi:hypothetical protein
VWVTRGCRCTDVSTTRGRSDEPIEVDGNSSSNGLELFVVRTNARLFVRGRKVLEVKRKCARAESSKGSNPFVRVPKSIRCQYDTIMRTIAIVSVLICVALQLGCEGENITHCGYACHQANSKMLSYSEKEGCRCIADPCKQTDK